VPKRREIINGEVECPILKLFGDVVEKEIVPLKECKKCKNFVGIEDGAVLCAYAWI